MLGSVSPASAADLPPIKISAHNSVPACVTPGRLMAYLKANNPSLPARYAGLADEYRRLGDKLAIRWDYAFFQMLVETAFLKYTGDVRAEQNNFAGLGATGNGVRGESFKDISSGVEAHLQHVLMYTGTEIENPVADRTRKIQEWKVLATWQKSIKGPMTYTDLSRQWAPTARGYPRDIAAVADRFFGGACKAPDPASELADVATGGAAGPAKAEAAAKKVPEDAATTAQDEAKTVVFTETGKAEKAAPAAQTTGKDAAQKAASGKTGQSAAGATDGSALGSAEAIATATTAGKVKVLNPRATESAEDAAAKTEAGGDAKTSFETASIAGAAKAAGAAAKSDAAAPSAGAAGGDRKQQKCRVWTASYGGAKAVIIRAVAEKIVNYTVLDVNEGAEKREAEAYIVAYAKGGETVGEFPNQSQALDKAFQLCPES